MGVPTAADSVPNSTDYAILAVGEMLVDLQENDCISSDISVLDGSSIEEHERTYHSYNAGSYLLPNDGLEQERLDLQHQVTTLMMDGQLAWAPSQEPHNMLDLGTGTVIGAIKFARRVLGCNVTGRI